MSRIFGWQIWLPRLLLVAVSLLAVQYVLGLAARTAVIRTGEARIGAQVELAHARVSLVDRQIVLRDLRVVDPHRPGNNLVEADRCELKFAAGPLLEKRAIIEHGTISGLRFGTPRDGCGGLAASSPATAAPIAWVGDDEARAARQWLDQLGERFESDFVEQLESVRRTAVLCNSWSEHSAALDERVRQLNRRSDDLQQIVGEAANPLRHADSLTTASDEIIALRQEYENLAAQVEGLPDRVDAERRAIIAARRHDEPWLREQLRVPAIDANALAAFYLREQIARPLGEMIGWLRFVRQVVPAQEATATATGQAGEDVFFAGCQRSPRFLIRALELQGMARSGGRAAEVRGTLSDFASTPAAHERPMRLRLTTTGSQPLSLQATIDRTGAVARDELLVDCQGILLPKISLGESDQFRLTIAPSVGALSISANLEGERLTSDIQLVQKHVQVTPDAGGSLSDASINAAFRDVMKDVDAFVTRISLRGTLEKPQCSLSSDFGPVVAQALDRALQKATGRHARRLFAESQQRVDGQLAELERKLSETQGRLLPQLAQAAGRLERIAAEQSPPQRISSEQLGRRLPANSLFR